MGVFPGGLVGGSPASCWRETLPLLRRSEIDAVMTLSQLAGGHINPPAPLPHT